MTELFHQRVFSWSKESGPAFYHGAQPAHNITTTLLDSAIEFKCPKNDEIVGLKLFWNLRCTGESIQWSTVLFESQSQEYTATVPVTLTTPGGLSKLQYAVAYRTNTGEKSTWRWNDSTEVIDDESSPPDDQTQVLDLQQMIAKNTTMTPETLKELLLEDLFPNVDSSLSITSINSTTVRITGRAVVEPSKTTKSLGKPAHIRHFLAHVRADANWLQPRTGYEHITLDKPAVAFSFGRNDDIHVVIIGLSGLNHNCTSYIVSNSDGGIAIETQNDSDIDQEAGIDVLVGYGTDPEMVFKSLFEVAQNLIARTQESSSINAHFSSPSDGTSISRHTWNPYWYDGLMYCTWNGLGSHLTHDSIIDALQDFHDAGIRISGIIIDDGWQSTRGDRLLYDFEARKEDFPTGLKGLIAEIKQRFSYIENIGVWSTIIGYWNGFEPGSKLEQMFDCIHVPFDRFQDGIIIPRKEDAQKFYETYFSFLRDAGVTCVKIDNQATFDKIKSPKVRGELWQEYQDQLWAAALKFFDGKIIYCMAMVPNIMFYALQRPVASKYIPVFRNSDDFFPNVISSHYWHIYCNFYNSIFTRNLHALPDYDMFQTYMRPDHSDDDEFYARFPKLHAVARALSGGPVYITDAPELHDLKLMNLMAGKDSTGRHMVVRFDEVALPADIYRPFHTDGLLRVTNQYGNGIGVLGIFNFVHQTIVGRVTISDFKFESSDSAHITSYAMRSFNTGETWYGDAPGNVLLEAAEADIITAVPLVPLGTDVESKIAVFGITSCLSGAAAMDSYDLTLKPGGILVTVLLKIYGTLGIFTTFHINGNVMASSTVVDNLLEIEVNEKNSSMVLADNFRPLIKVEVFLPTDQIGAIKK